MPNDTLTVRSRLIAIGGMLLFIGLMILYVREFPVLSNTIGVSKLVFGALAVGVAPAAGILYRLRDRFKPWERHIPEVFIILIASTLFMPLFASLLNRGLGSRSRQSFEFLSETAYVSTAYGVFINEKIKPSGYYLHVRENGRMLRFRYKKQAYYPLTKPGEPVLLPVRKGLFGFRVVEME